MANKSEEIIVGCIINMILFVLLQDELQTTKRGYDGQLSMMSEHLAAMNEKLTTQKDEIDVLKYQLQNNQTKVSTMCEPGIKYLL